MITQEHTQALTSQDHLSAAAVLGVHRSITVAALLGDRLPELTPYLLRPHDKNLRQQLLGTVRNQMMVLVGESSTGKTRAMFEAVRECLGDWSLVHPLDVTELLALAAPGVLPPRCVVWLNESQRYIDEPRAAMVLRRLLRGPGPVVLLGSLWPGEWDRFVANPKDGAPDVHTLARELLGFAHRVIVPRALTENDLKKLDSPELRDPRWSTARQTSGDRRRAIQVLAGGVYLAQRYDHGADPYGRALVSAAIDLRRIGLRGPIRLALLREAALGYLTAEERAVHDDQWLTTGLEHATSKHNGISALTLVHADEGMGEPDSVELHDYLIQHGQLTRKTLPVPTATWEALIAHADRPDDRARIAENAYHRGLWRISAQLAIPAARAGDLAAVHRVRERLISARWEEAEKWHKFALEIGDTNLVWRRIDDLFRADKLSAELYRRLEQLAESGEAEAMWQLACLHEDTNDEVAFSWLRRAVAAGHENAATALVAEGFEKEAEKLLAEAAIAGHGSSMHQLALLLEHRGRHDLADRWWRRMARCRSGSLQLVFDRDRKRSARLWSEAADEDNINAVRHLADHYLTFDTTSNRAIPLLRRLVAHGDRDAMVQLAEALEQCGELVEAERLWIFMVEENVYRSSAVFELSRFLARHAPERGERIVRRLAEGGDEEAMWCYSLNFVDRRSPAQRDEWVRRAAEHGHGLALSEASRRLVETETAENFEKWARHTVVANHTGYSGGVFAVFHELADLLERTGRGEEAERLRAHGLEPDGSTGRPWDISALFLEGMYVD